MPTKARHYKGGGKLGRSELVTIRLDPQLRYLTELAARVQRRTVSSFIEWAIDAALGQVNVGVDLETPCLRSLRDEADMLWDVDEPDRFVKLADGYPGLLTHEEQVLWKRIRERADLWHDFAEPLMLDIQRLRQEWATLKGI